MAAVVHNVLSGEAVSGFPYAGLLPVMRPEGRCGVSSSTRESSAARKQREFIPDAKKDDSYWDRRRRNNEAAKRSREKRRFNDMILEQRVLELSKEAHILRAQVNAFENKFHVKAEDIINEDQVLSSLPQADHLLSLNRRSNGSFLPMRSTASGMLSPITPSISSPPLHTPAPLGEEEGRLPPQPPLPHPYTEPPPPLHHASPHRPHSPHYFDTHQQAESNFNTNSVMSNHNMPQYHFPEERFCTNDLPSTALNLSARSDGSRSPEHHMDFTENNLSPESSGRILPDSSSNGSSLPLKLRHKGSHNTSRNPTVGILTSHLNSINRHYAQHRALSTSPLSDGLPHGLYSGQAIKSEQRSDEPGLDSAYESGTSVTSSPPHMDTSLARNTACHDEVRASLSPHMLDGDYTNGLTDVGEVRIRRVYKKRNVAGEPSSSTDQNVIKAELAKIYGELDFIKSKISRDTIDSVNLYHHR